MNTAAIAAKLAPIAWHILRPVLLAAGRPLFERYERELKEHEEKKRTEAAT